MTRVTSGLLLALLLVLGVPAAHAQTSDASSGGDELGSPSDGGVRTVSSGTALSDEQATMEEDDRDDAGGRAAGGRARPAADDPDAIASAPMHELPDHDYFFAGAFFRGIVVPDFIQGLFVSYRGGSALNWGGGGYFGWRRNGFNVMAEVWYAGFGHEGFYHGNGAADTEYEWVDVDLGVVMGNLVFGWSVPITEWLGIDILFGLGFGGMTGNIYRQEATPDSTSSAGYRRCESIADGNPAYCNSSGGAIERPGTNGRLDDTRVRGETYQYSGGSGPGTPGTGPNPFYFGDGGVPPMFFWLDLPRIGFNIRPIPQIQLRIEGGYNLYGFNFGASLGYGF